MIEEKYQNMVNFKKLKRSHELEKRMNGDVIADIAIQNMHGQEGDEGFNDYPRRIWQGTAHKSAKIWATTFRVYNILKHVKTNNMNVLDVGCDDAWIRKAIHNGTYVSGTNYLGLDIDHGKLVRASNSIPKINNPALFVVQDLHNGLPFIKNNSVDLLLAMEVFEHIHPENALQVAEEFARILQPSGLLYLTMPHYDPSQWYVPKKHLKEHGKIPYHHKEYTIPEFKKICWEAGMEVFKVSGWFSDSRRLKAALPPDVREVYDHLVDIMGTQIPTQVIGQLYPEVAGSVTYYVRRR